MSGFNYRKKLLLLGLLVLCFCFLSVAISLPAEAVLRQHHAAPGVLEYHSQHSLKDTEGRTWQVILFPDRGDLLKKYYLRLVGFPGLIQFLHPQSLEINTSAGKIFTARDVFAQSTPAANVGQYDLTPILPELSQKGALKLAVPLEGNRDLSLEIAEPIIIEWQWLIEEI